MALTPDETERLRALLSDLPLSKQAPGFITDLASQLDSRAVQAGHIFFDTGTPVGTLYLLAEGAVTQTMGSSGQPWYQKDLVPGEFFGQRSLVSGQHQTKAVATADSTVFSLPAVSLSALLDRYSGLREVLWRETCASRLRSIPLFESLADDEIGWLAELVEEVSLDAGSEVPLYDRPGVWIIDSGQVEVAGPAANLPSAASAAPASEPQWVITGGNFFFTLQPGMHFGGKCAATWARVVHDTRFFFMKDRHFNRMLAALPGIRPVTDDPLDIPAHLRTVPLFSGSNMTEEHLRHLAQVCAWEFVPANQNISTQGTVGYSFVKLLKGAALVSAVDDKGRLRPVHVLQPGEFYGQTSLLESTRRDATVRAVAGSPQAGQVPFNGAEILNLDRRDLQVAFAERPDLWHHGVWLFDKYRQLKEERPRYEWLDEGEDVIWTDRGHIWWLAGPLILEFLIMVLVLGGLTLALDALSLPPQSIALADFLVFAFIFVPITIYVAWNYHDDYYAVTNRRVTRHDREPFASDARIEAPLESVQDVTYNADLMGRVFNFGDVSIRTAAKVGSLVFNHVPDPADVVDRITAAKSRRAVAVRGHTKESLRRGLMTDLRLALTVPDLDTLRALGDKVTPNVSLTRSQRLLQQLRPYQKRPKAVPGRNPPPPSLARRLFAPLPERWRLLLVGPPPRPPKPWTGEIIWRKHWVNLFSRGAPAFGSLAVLLVMGLVLLVAGRRLLGDLLIEVLFAWFFLFFVVIFWCWYHLVDWQNDLYVVTDERIIDIQKRPLALSTTQRESSLENIQTVDSKQPTLWAKMLNFGDVVIRTAAADEGFVFRTVPSPMLVQKTIFQKVDAYRRRQEDRRIDDRRRDVVEGLQVYHELREGSQRTPWH